MTFGRKTLPDGRVVYDRNKLEPELAESWQIAPDGKSVTLQAAQERQVPRRHAGDGEGRQVELDRAVTVGGFPTFQMAAGSLEKPEQFEVVDEHTFRVEFLRKRQADDERPRGAGAVRLQQPSW